MHHRVAKEIVKLKLKCLGPRGTENSDLANVLRIHDKVVIVTFGYCCSSMGGCNLKFE